jgi:putative ABC transport system ATP-binding protein
MSSPALIELAAVTKHFQTPAETLHVLNGVSLKLHPGETLAVTGPSGSGKSTLLGLMAGLERPTAGKVLYRGADLSELDEEALARWRRGSVGFIFQSFRLIESLTALENVALPLEILGRGALEAAVRAEELLAEIGMAARKGHFPRQLSGGEQQRVAIARAYVHGPEVVFADEPTGNLDRETAAKVLDLLLKFQQGQKAALVLVTHDQASAGRMKTALALADGRVTHERR